MIADNINLLYIEGLRDFQSLYAVKEDITEIVSGPFISYKGKSIAKEGIELFL